MSELVCPVRGIHVWILSAVRRLSFQDLGDQEIFDAVFALTRGARRHVPDAEIWKSIAKVRGTNLCAMPPRPRPEIKPQYQPETLARLAGRLPETVSTEYLALRSKFTCWNRSPAGFLHKLYRSGERIVVFDVFESQGCEVWTHPGPAGDLSTLNYLQEGCWGVWYLVQPVDGDFHHNPREGKVSRRSEESITSFRYVCVESDQADAGQWLRALVQLPLPIASIYSSGRKSIHVLIRIDAKSKSEWDRIVAALKPSLVSLGACPGSLSAVRLSRLPGCMRAETGRMQELLYLDDDPDDVPICHKEPRNMSMLLATWRKKP